MNTQVMSQNISVTETLCGRTRQYKLEISDIRNTEIADQLGLEVGNNKDSHPHCCFFSIRDGALVAIRTKPDEVIIFDQFKTAQEKMIACDIGKEAEIAIHDDSH